MCSLKRSLRAIDFLEFEARGHKNENKNVFIFWVRRA